MYEEVRCCTKQAEQCALQHNLGAFSAVFVHVTVSIMYVYVVLKTEPGPGIAWSTALYFLWAI